MKKNLDFNINVSPSFKFLYSNDINGVREVFLEGGRAGGKTHEIGQFFIIQSLRNAGTKRIVFRETQSEVRLLKDLFQDILDSLNIEALITEEWEEVEIKGKILRIKNSEIEFFNKSKIILSFINDEVATRRKSLNGVCEAWVEEARYLTEYTHRLLKPTIREGVARIFYTYNPLWKDDFIYSYAREMKGERYIHKVINCYDNIFCPNSLLYDMAEDFKMYPKAKAEQIWLGKPYESLEDCLFTKEILEKMAIDDYSFDRARYLRVVVSLDPATTSNANLNNAEKFESNESGIVVLGITKEGVVECIDDLSGRLNPNEMASRVSQSYHKYNADCVVVETNQGGDLLKFTILGFDNSLRVKGVWAVNDKIKRAMPVANEAYLGNIKLPRRFTEIKKQMERMTYKGYLGAKGESPDRLDAFGWGVYELLGISDYATQGTLFKLHDLQAEINGLILIDKAVFIYVMDSEFGVIDFSLYDSLGIHKFKIRDSYIKSNDDLESTFNQYNTGGYSIFTNSDLNIPNDFLSYYDSFSENEIDTIAQRTKNLIKDRVNLSECKENEYKGFYGNLLLTELLKFKTDEKNQNPLFYAFCAMILN